MRSFVIIGLLALLSGCMSGDPTVQAAIKSVNKNLESKGSPYRAAATTTKHGSVISRKLMGTPSPTAADAVLKRDVMNLIEESESNNGVVGPVNIVETRLIDRSSSYSDEIWVVQRTEKKVAYTVLLKASPNGGVDINLNGPW